MTKRRFVGVSFSHVGPIRPERDERGEILAVLPHSGFRNGRNLSLHSYGKGPFCRFQVAVDWQFSGVFILTSGDQVLYVGETKNLKDRWGPRGFGRISRVNCYKGGQETNCRINQSHL